MSIVTGTGCVAQEWDLEQAMIDGGEDAQIKTCGSLDNVESFVVISNSSSYSRGKSTCVDVTVEVVCKHPVLKNSKKNPAE